jgi:hypothetical protein
MNRHFRGLAAAGLVGNEPHTRDRASVILLRVRLQRRAKRKSPRGADLSAKTHKTEGEGMRSRTRMFSSTFVKEISIEFP